MCTTCRIEEIYLIAAKQGGSTHTLECQRNKVISNNN